MFDACEPRWFFGANARNARRGDRHVGRETAGRSSARVLEFVCRFGSCLGCERCGIGLRTSVSRSGGELIGRRLGDHSLYMDPLYARDMGGFKYASVTMREILLGTREERDVYSCFYGKDCSPMTTVGVRIPDSILRANQDSLVVRFFPAAVEPWTITLHHDLISAYLKTVDSVVAEFRTNTAR